MPPPPAKGDGGLSAYELEREANIRQNQKKLVALGLESVVPRAQPSGTRTANKRPREQTAPHAPSRASDRLRGHERKNYVEEDPRSQALAPRRGASSSSASGSSSSATVPATVTAITFRQPFASGIMRGAKRVENRSFAVPLGWIAVHAGATPHDDAALVALLRGAWVDMPATIDHLPRSAVLGFMKVVRVLKHSAERPHHELAADPQAVGPVCWVIGEVAPLAQPVRGVAGRQSVWRWAPPLELELPAQVPGLASPVAVPDGSASSVACVSAAPDAAAWDAAAAAAQALRVDGAAGAKLRLHPSLAFADVYVLAGALCDFSTCLALGGLGVRIEVGGGPGARALELPLPLRPVSDGPPERNFFDCSGGVWRLRWMLEAPRRRSRMVNCSPPPRTPWHYPLRALRS